jgi:hypothetical protein
MSPTASRGAHPARDYLVEVYGVRGADPDAVDAAVRTAVEALRAAGADVSYGGRVDIPDDETTFHLFRAAARDVVDDIVRRAGLAPERVVEAQASHWPAPPVASDTHHGPGPVPGSSTPQGDPT